MSRATELPPELWLAILGLVIEESIDPVQHCTYLTFPEISLHLRMPWEFPMVINPSLHRLRLVCHAFKRLLHPSPYFLMGDLGQMIPTNTRALYVKSALNTQLCLERLLAEPGRCRRIVLFNLLEAEPQSSPHAILFETLYDNAQLLPELRSLAVRVRNSTPGRVQISQFWERLDDSFPLLTSLVLRGGLYTTYPSRLVTFQKLGLFDWDHVEPYRNMRFPALRYAALSTITPLSFGRFAPWPFLESLVLRSMHFGAQVPWALMPNLRLLGIPQVDGYTPLAVQRLPEGHPLQHLQVYVGSRSRDDCNRTEWSYNKELIWLKETIKLLPNLTEIVFIHPERSDTGLPVIQGNFSDKDLRRLNFTDEDPSTERRGRTRITLSRIVAKPDSKLLMGSILPRPDFRAGWNKLLGLDSRKFRH